MRSMEKEKHPKAIEFGKAFATIARAHNRTLKSLHVELEVSDSYISTISTGKRVPSPQLLGNYLAALEPLTECELDLLLEPYAALLVEGFVPPEKGKFSPDGRERHAQANAQREFTPELRNRMSEAASGNNNANYGKPLSESVRQKISEALKGEKNPNYGRGLSDELKQRISVKLRGRQPNPEAVKKMVETKRKKTIFLRQNETDSTS